MKALLKVMESSNPSPNDINTLMVLTRDLVKRIPEGSIKLPFNFGSNDIGNMGLPETGDIIVNIRGVPHIVTEMGKSCFEYTIPDCSRMTRNKNVFTVIFFNFQGS